MRESCWDRGTRQLRSSIIQTSRLRESFHVVKTKKSSKSSTSEKGVISLGILGSSRLHPRSEEIYPPGGLATVLYLPTGKWLKTARDLYKTFCRNEKSEKFWLSMLRLRDHSSLSSISWAGTRNWWSQMLGSYCLDCHLTESCESNSSLKERMFLSHYLYLQQNHSRMVSCPNFFPIEELLFSFLFPGFAMKSF